MVPLLLGLLLLLLLASAEGDGRENRCSVSPVEPAMLLSLSSERADPPTATAVATLFLSASTSTPLSAESPVLL
uniref:Putative secreted protein n=1 Tax=Anopheles darlingi TaxID=43151 RepID=A0A2M4DGU0_ANODA